VFLSLKYSWYALILPLSFRNLKTEVPEDAVHEVRRLEVGGVDHVVTALGVFEQPRTLIGCVVVDEVSDGEDVPVILYHSHESFHVLHRIFLFLEKDIFDLISYWFVTNI